MNADDFRKYYDYHFAENRKLWDKYILPLTQEHFTQKTDYSHGSVRNQVVHIISTDETWFTELRDFTFFDPLDPDRFGDRQTLRAYWDKVEQDMRNYLAKLSDDMLKTKPFPEGEDKDLILWQVLLHVVNHGTDHRAQILRQINDMGFRTGSQDYIFYVYESNAA